MIKLPNIYNQQDNKWSTRLLGFNTNPLYNFFNYACLISCLAMIAKYYGKSADPISIDEALKQLNIGGYVPKSGIYVHGSITKIYPDIQEVRTNTPGLLTDAQLIEISKAIQDGFPVMFHIDTNITTVRPDSHFVVAIAMDPVDENNVTIADPIGGRIHSLKDYPGGVRRLVAEYFIYRGTVPTDYTDDPLVQDRKSVRDMLVTKASNFDVVADHIKMLSDTRKQPDAGYIIVDYIKGLETRLNSTQYTPVTTTGDGTIVPSKQDESMLFQDVSTVLKGFLDKIRGKK